MSNFLLDKFIFYRSLTLTSSTNPRQKVRLHLYFLFYILKDDQNRTNCCKDIQRKLLIKSQVNKRYTSESESNYNVKELRKLKYL